MSVYPSPCPSFLSSPGHGLPLSFSPVEGQSLDRDSLDRTRKTTSLVAQNCPALGQRYDKLKVAVLKVIQRSSDTGPS